MKRRYYGFKIISLIGLIMPLVLSAQTTEYQTQAITGVDKPLPVFYEALRDRMPFILGWKADLDFPKWKAVALEKAREIMIPWEDSTPFDMKIIDTVDRGTYTAQKVVFNISRDSRVLAYLLVPRGTGPFPAALMLHDHGSKFDIGKEKLVEPWGDEEKRASSRVWIDKYYGGRYVGDELAKRGFVVLSFDALGWGDRSVKGWSTEAQQALAANLMNMGVSYAGLIALEDVRAARFLASLPEVDTSRLVAVGFSMGAFRSWQVAALSPDIKAAVVVNWMATMQGLMVPGNNQLKGQSAFTMLHPFIGRYLDYPDVAGLAAPKPMLVYAGEADTLFPVPSVKQAFEKLQAIWKAARAPEKLETRLWATGHIYDQEKQEASFVWLERQFGLVKQK
ncbi:MAG: alpha/beta fold hydrolase [Breznakiellaceae bacterium]